MAVPSSDTSQTVSALLAGASGTGRSIQQVHILLAERYHAVDTLHHCLKSPLSVPQHAWSLEEDNSFVQEAGKPFCREKHLGIGGGSSHSRLEVIEHFPGARAKSCYTYVCVSVRAEGMYILIAFPLLSLSFRGLGDEASVRARKWTAGGFGPCSAALPLRWAERGFQSRRSGQIACTRLGWPHLALLCTSLYGSCPPVPSCFLSYRC